MSASGASSAPSRTPGPLRVCFDAAVLGLGRARPETRTGVYRTVAALAGGLAARDDLSVALTASRAAAWVRLCAQEEPSLRDAAASGGPVFRAAGALHARLAKRGRGNSFAARLMAKACDLFAPGPEAAGADLYHSPFHPLPPPGRTGPGPRVLTVYDLVPVLFPQWMPEGHRHLAAATLQSLRQEDWALCISECTRADLLAHAPRLDPARVVVTHLAASNYFHAVLDPRERTRVRTLYGLPERPYALSLCTLEPRKNVEQAVRAFARLVRQERLDDLDLVLVGAKGWQFHALFTELGLLGELRARVILTGFVEDSDLAALYSGAKMFLYPSRYEGFGLPCLEAMRCGVPVVSSDTSSLPEVVGDAGLMVDPDDTDGLCGAMLTLHRDEAMRDTLRKRALARAATFTWERCVDETVAVYRRAIQS